ncbi:MAG: prepilin-type N-terminal cleavage/methylation domain-containing protein [Planctomycetes bacterium]|nr:prepilin-type N-terminal cleavage/methylation domain-containing protein [Planctomycetota bacterium]
MRRRDLSVAGVWRAGASEGFTLVEVMIVIAIIAVLASITLTAVRGVQRAANEASAKTTVLAIAESLETYFNHEGVYPAFGKKSDPERNDFPILYNALMDVPKSEGGLGGRGSPYLDKVEEKIIAVEMDDGTYQTALRDQRNDRKIAKYFLDPWGNPFIYRCNKGLKQLDYMKNRNFDIYSKGPNEQDDTIVGLEGDENDDIGNW